MDYTIISTMAEDSKAKKKEVKKVETKPQQKVEKPKSIQVDNIIVQHDDEVSFILEGIQESNSDRVAISIPTGSDMLVSSVGMKLIAQCSDAVHKDVAIVTDDKLGAKMADLAGIVVAPSTGDLSESTWDTAKKYAEEREKKARLPQQKTKEEPTFGQSDIPGQISDISDTEKEAGENAVSTKDAEKIEMGKDTGISAIPVVNAGVKSVKTVKKGNFEMEIDTTPIGGEKEEKSNYEEAVLSTASMKSSLEIPLDKKTFVGRDFSGAPSIPMPQRKLQEKKLKPAQVFNASASQMGVSIVDKIKAFFKGIDIKKIFTPKAGAKIGRLLLPLGIVIVAVCAFLYWYLPEVVVELKVESISVTYAGDVTSSLSTDVTDVTNARIQAKSESVQRSGSENGTATGVAARGDKATGSITVYNKTSDDVTLGAGTIVTDGTVNFVITTEVVVPKRPDPIGMGSVAANVEAADIGTEYNLAATTTFSVGDYAQSAISAVNSAAFSGGTKEEYKVVTQEDIDKLADQIKTRLYDEAKAELSRKNQNTDWIFVDTAIKNQVDGDVVSDVAAGTERDNFNVTLNTISTALYYDRAGLNEVIESGLMDSLEGDTDIEGLELSDQLEQTVTVKSSSVDEGNVVLSVSVSGFVMPQLDPASIERDLQGRTWTDGLRVLMSLEYIKGDPEVDFYPAWFPEFMKRMPSRNGQIIVNVENVAPEDETDSTVDEGTENVPLEELPAE